MPHFDRELGFMLGSWLSVAGIAAIGGPWPLFAIGAGFVTWWALRQ